MIAGEIQDLLYAYIIASSSRSLIPTCEISASDQMVGAMINSIKFCRLMNAQLKHIGGDDWLLYNSRNTAI